MKNKAAIKHIEFWTPELKRSMKFYNGILSIIGWKEIGENAFSNGQTKIYFTEQDVEAQKTIGPRHICFLAGSHKEVDDVGQFLTKNNCNIIRGPLESHYKNRNSYTVDFRDPDGYVIEVATESVAVGN